MAKTKIERIDNLFQSSVAEPLGPDNAPGQELAVGIIQELLTCQGYEWLPTVRLTTTYGKFNKTTIQSLKDFRVKNGLQKPTDPIRVDHWTLRRLVQEKAKSPRASLGYIALALDMEISGLMRILSLVSLAEGAGMFSAFNANTDKQGLSYGIIQWSQKQERLVDIVGAYQLNQSQLFTDVFGNNAADMVTHTRKPKGGVDPKTGITIDPKFDLVSQLWKGRFQKAAEDKLFQKIQVETAIQAFQKIITHLRIYGDKIHSQRGYAFMIDLANQHGDSEKGVKRIYNKVVTADMSEADALAKITEESVRIVRARYPPPPDKDKSNEERATQDRRDFFRTTPLLSDTDFDEN